ncbi:TIGR00730 family Rossman fold protein [Companilactobacillus sp. HBUAS56275]|uniref:Cytokinin riboside 5'-monophosphate phosphoribohydrolase n=1 Tax=Candidatus Companilactobacillus pullicola TaxID=2838523 RepID=A0A9D2CN21_9LACO|nr:TIGR00730 family Rossman fold protein [Candidatus Companilactobacillus pullicola]
MKNIAVYCGASVGNQEIYTTGAEKLGKWIVQNNYGLTYGGGNNGLMNVVADSVLEENGFVHGIITQQLYDRNLAHDNLSSLDIVDTMSERKEAMLKDSVANIALPGGPGTLEEISEAFSWTIIGVSSHPCIFYNVNHYYDKLESFFDEMVDQGFMAAKTRETLLFSDSLEEINDFIQSYIPPKLRKYQR